MRVADYPDILPVMRALRGLLAKSTAAHMAHADEDAANRSVYRAIEDGRAFVVDGYFIMVEVGRDWYTFDTYLIEQIILKIGPSERNDVGMAVRALDDIAKRFNAKAIAVGDTQMGMMLPHYQAAGYKVLGTQLFKES